MNIIVSFFLLFIFFAFTEIVKRIRPMGLGRALPVAFALMIGFESILLNGLSIFHSVNRLWLSVCHLIFLLLWWITLRNNKKQIVNHFDKFRKLLLGCINNPAVLILIPLIILFLRTAYIFPPNNYDSMTYHMGRVAHWLLSESVAYFPTPIERQNVLGPGAEYLILVLQILLGNDQLANFIQLFSYILLIPSIIYLLRVFKVSRKIAPYILLLTATAPMALLQATSSQNDLVASVMTYGIIFSLLRFLVGKIDRVTRGDYFLIGTCLASGFLVKPTALLVASPFIGLSLLFQVKNLIKNIALTQKLVRNLLMFVIAFISIAGPDLYRKVEHNTARHEVYPLFTEWTAERFLNPLRTMDANMPIRNDTRRILKVFGYKVPIDTGNVFNGHEDFAGNPYQFLALLIMSGMTVLTLFLFSKKAISGRYFFLSLAPLFSWLVFALVVRHQVWISRLQLPIFFVLPFSFIFYFHVIRDKLNFSFISRLIIIWIAFLSTTYGVLTAVKNPSRSLFLVQMWGERPSRHREYYRNGGEMEAHNLLFKKAQNSQCNRIGVISGPDSVDYPLVWRAKELGIQTKYLWDFSNGPIVNKFKLSSESMQWPCMIFVASGCGGHITEKDHRWNVTENNSIFYRNVEWEYNQLQGGIDVIAMMKRNGIRGKNDLILEDSHDGLLITATGKDPYIILPELLRQNSPSCIYRVEIVTEKDTEIQIFYNTKKEKTFSEKLSIKRKISKGANVVYFQLPIDEIAGSLRLDPGRIEGKYLLSSIEYKPIF